MAITNIAEFFEIHECNERGDRNNDKTIEVLQCIKIPPKESTFPNTGIHNLNLDGQIGMHGMFINYCPYCAMDLRLKKTKPEKAIFKGNFIVDSFECDCGKEINTNKLTNKQIDEGYVTCLDCSINWVIKV